MSANILDITAPVPKISASLWLTYKFAPDWFQDAIDEAKKAKGDQRARRREIIFSVAFTESYIVEWVRDAVLNSDFNRFGKYFPEGCRLPVKDKWKDIPKQLFEDRLMPKPLNLGRPFWGQFLTLVDYRDGLVHAGTSRPECVTSPGMTKPLPSLNILTDLEPGWALNTAVNLVQELHDTMGTPAPDYMSEIKSIQVPIS